MSAQSLMKAAEKKLKEWSFFGMNNNNEAAAELYNRAAAKFKTERDFHSAGQAFEEGAKCYEKAKQPLDALPMWKEAGKAWKKADVSRARQCFARAIQYYQDQNRFNAAAKLHEEIANTFLEDGNKEKAIEAYRNASQCHLADDDTNGSNKKLLEAAHHLAMLNKYEDAIKIYEQAARDSLDNQLLRWSVKGYLFKAGTCQLCYAAPDNKLESAKESLDRYDELSEIYRGSRESNLLSDLLDAMMRGDVGLFSQKIQEFDDVTTLDKWMVDRFLFVKAEYFKDVVDDNAHDADEFDLNDDNALKTNVTITKKEPETDVPDLF